jgi:hypothetical protein
MYLVGSRAINEYTPQTWKDTDIVCSEDELKSLGLSFGPNGQIKKDGIEFIDGKLLNNEDVKVGNIININTLAGSIKVGIPPVEYLYAIKRSHIHRPLNFSKHIIHLHKLKPLVTFPLSDECQNFLKERTRLTKLKWPDRTPSLNKSNDEFFDDYVKKEYVHDDIHKVVAFGSIPVYEKMKRDFSQAKCEKDMWMMLSHQDKIRCVQEEAMVISLERFIITKKLNPKLAYYKAVEKICTNLTSGWFRDFAIDNWDQVIDNVPDYVSIFNAAVAEGRIKKYDKEKS